MLRMDAFVTLVCTYFTDRVWIASLLGRHKTHEIQETCGDTKGKDNSHVRSNVLESLDKGVSNVNLQQPMERVL